MDFGERFEQLLKLQAKKQVEIKKLEETLLADVEKEADELTKIIEQEFRKVLNDIGPLKHSSPYADESTAEVQEFSVTYSPGDCDFEIKIDLLKNSEGKLCGQGNYKICPHNYMDKLTGIMHDVDPRIEDFMVKYNVWIIDYPDNSCDHD
jgi:hypothetical protein